MPMCLISGCAPADKEHFLFCFQVSTNNNLKCHALLCSVDTPCPLFLDSVMGLVLTTTGMVRSFQGFGEKGRHPAPCPLLKAQCFTWEPGWALAES